MTPEQVLSAGEVAGAGRLRDVLLTGPHPPPYGGPGVHMLHLRRALEARGATCAVLSIWANGETTTPGVYRVRSGLEFCRRVSGFVRRGFHVHHLFNVESPKAVILAATAAVLSRLMRGTYSIGFIGGPRQRFLDRKTVPWSALFRFSLRTARFVICNNDQVVEALVRAGAVRSRVHPIPAFHAGQIEDIGEPDAAARRFMDERDPVLCAIVHPRFETECPHHEMELLVGAMGRLLERFPNSGCVVMGGAGHVAEYGRMARAAGLEERFQFTGELSHRDCLGVMAESDVFIRAYLKDGTSSSVREALALGTPAVVSRNSQHPPGARQFVPNDAASLATTLLNTLGDPAAIDQHVSGSTAPEDTGALERELSLFSRISRPLER